MFFLPQLRERKIKPYLEKEKTFYQNMTIDQVESYQLHKFNQEWERIQVHVEFYKNLVIKKEAPRTFDSFKQLKELPIITRDFVSKNIHLFTNTSKEADSWGTTGGSTGNPLTFPKWQSETVHCEPSVWYVRDFYGVKRSDRMFRLWGHSHTLGKGLARVKNKLKFDIGLPLIGFKRFSAYDLSEEKLKEAGEQILKFKPKYIIGYSKALFMLAKANEDKKEMFHQLNLKVVLGAAEGFERSVDREFVSEIFGCPVGLQYAAMETNYIAQTHPDGEYKALWKNNIIECVDDNGNPAETGRVLLTSLYPRAFPLVRYELGDIISECKKDKHSVYSFKEIKGRDNDFLMLDENTPIHSEGITHAIKFSDKIIAYQIRYTKDMKYTIYVKSKDELMKPDIEEIRFRLKQVDERLEQIEIIQSENLKQTVAGKTRWLVEE